MIISRRMLKKILNHLTFAIALYEKKKETLSLTKDVIKCKSFSPMLCARPLFYALLQICTFNNSLQHHSAYDSVYAYVCAYTCVPTIFKFETNAFTAMIPHWNMSLFYKLPRESISFENSYTYQ